MISKKIARMKSAWPIMFAAKKSVTAITRKLNSAQSEPNTCPSDISPRKKTRLVQAIRNASRMYSLTSFLPFFRNSRNCVHGAS